jgi:hypothetical protein
MKPHVLSTATRSYLTKRYWRNSVFRVSVSTDGLEQQCSVPSKYWSRISEQLDRECDNNSWGQPPSARSDGKVLTYESIQPYAILSGLFNAISGPVGLGAKIVSQKQRDQLISSLIEIWFADKLYLTNDLASNHDQFGQRWIDALPISAARCRPSFISPLLTSWLVDRIRSRTVLNRGAELEGHYFRWITHEGRNGLSILAAHFNVGDERAYALGPIISSQPQDFGIARKASETEEQRALEFLLNICGADADAARFEHPRREMTVQSALRAILFAARSGASISQLNLPSTGSLFSAL